MAQKRREKIIFTCIQRDSKTKGNKNIYVLSYCACVCVHGCVSEWKIKKSVCHATKFLQRG